MKVSELMTHNVQSCSLDATAADAARAMWDFDIGCVPVVDAGGTVIGMVTDRDVCMGAYTQGKPPGAIPITEIMSTAVACCHPDDTLASAEQTMRERQVRRLPVVDGANKLVGLLSLNDLALAPRTPLARAKQRLRGDVEETLAAVSQHRLRPVGVQF